MAARKVVAFAIAIVVAIVICAWLALYLWIEFFGEAFFRRAFSQPGP